MGPVSCDGPQLTNKFLSSTSILTRRLPFPNPPAATLLLPVTKRPFVAGNSRPALVWRLGGSHRILVSSEHGTFGQQDSNPLLLFVYRSIIESMFLVYDHMYNDHLLDICA